MIRVEDLDKFACIVGAPRCGTTTLARSLKLHPGVCFPFVKEPHFFAQNDLRQLGDGALRDQVQHEYLDRFFSHCEPARRVGADASVTYLYSPEQLEPLLRLWPDSRFVIAVRDPLKMLPSLHSRLFYLGDENIRRFEDAWAAVPDRRAGRRIPRSCVEPRWLRYDEAARFGTYVEQFFAAVGRERCLVLVFDDLAADPAGQYQRMMRFFGLEPDPSIDLRARRRGYAVRVAWLQRLLKRPPKRLRQYMAGEHYLQRERAVEEDEGSGTDHREKIFAIRKRLLRWNRVPVTEQPVRLDVQQQIRDRLKDEVAHLGALIDRDLSHWLQPREAK
jgi:hypothetical protein